MLGTLVGCRFVSGAAVAGGSEVAGERLRRAAFGPRAEIPPSGESKLPGPPISGQKSSLRTVTYVDLERGAVVARGSEVAGDSGRLRRAAFVRGRNHPWRRREITPVGFRAKRPLSLRTVV